MWHYTWLFAPGYFPHLTRNACRFERWKRAPPLLFSSKPWGPCRKAHVDSTYCAQNYITTGSRHFIDLQALWPFLPCITSLMRSNPAPYPCAHVGKHSKGSLDVVSLNPLGTSTTFYPTYDHGLCSARRSSRIARRSHHS